MSRVIFVEYDAEHNVLKVEGKLEGAKDHERFKAAIEEVNTGTDPQPPWKKYCGTLSPAAGQDLANAIEEAGYGPAGG